MPSNKTSQTSLFTTAAILTLSASLHAWPMIEEPDSTDSSAEQTKTTENHSMENTRLTSSSSAENFTAIQRNNSDIGFKEEDQPTVGQNIPGVPITQVPTDLETHKTVSANTSSAQEGERSVTWEHGSVAVIASNDPLAGIDPRLVNAYIDAKDNSKKETTFFQIIGVNPASAAVGNMPLAQQGDIRRALEERRLQQNPATEENQPAVGQETSGVLVTQAPTDLATHRSSSSSSSSSASSTIAVEAGHNMLPVVQMPTIPTFDMGPIRVNDMTISAEMVDRYLTMPYPENRPQTFNYIVSTTPHPDGSPISAAERDTLYRALQQRLTQHIAHYGEPPSFGPYVNGMRDRTTDQQTKYRESVIYSQTALKKLRADREAQRLNSLTQALSVQQQATYKELIKTLSAEDEKTPTFGSAIANALTIINANEAKIETAIQTLSSDSQKNRDFNENRQQPENLFPITLRNPNLYPSTDDRPNPVTAATLSRVIFDSSCPLNQSSSSFQREDIVNLQKEIVTTLNEINANHKPEQLIPHLQALEANVAFSNALTNAFTYLAHDATLNELQMERIARSSRIIDKVWYETRFKTSENYDHLFDPNSLDATLSDTQQVMNLHISIASLYGFAANSFRDGRTAQAENAIAAAHEAENKLQSMTQEYVLK